MDILLLREAIVLVAGAIAAYTDYKTGYIYDHITHPLIAAGIILNIYEQQYTGLAIGAIVLAAGWLLYKTGKIGGGDVKLYAGIALVLPFFGNTIFILPVILFSAISGLAFISAYYVIKYAKRGIDFEYNRQGILNGAVLFAVIVLYFLAAGQLFKTNMALIYPVIFPLLAGIVFVSLERGIRKEFFLKKIKLKDADEDEVIAVEFMTPEQKAKIPTLKPLMTKEEILALEKSGVHQILVFRDLPRFGPFIFAGIVISLAILQLYPKIGIFTPGLA